MLQYNLSTILLISMIQKSISAALPRDRAFGIIASVASTLSDSLEFENYGAVPYLERYLIPQFSRRIVKISFWDFRTLGFLINGGCLIILGFFGRPGPY